MSMMKHALLAALFFLLFVQLAPAQGNTPPQDDFFTNTANGVSSTTQDFVDAGGAVGYAVPSAADTVFEAFGPASCGDDWFSTSGSLKAQSVISMWFAPAAFTAIIVAFGIGIIYMLGQLFQMPTLIALAKDESFQTALTVVRVFFLAGTLMAGEVWYTLTTGGSNDPIYENPKNGAMIDAAMAFSRQMVGDMTSHYSTLLMYNMVIHTLYSSTMWFGVTWRSMYSFNLGPVLKPLIDIVGSALQFLSVGISEWLMHIITLCLIKKWAWTLFIPAAILLRAFPYTRNAGEALFALVYALAVFYPFMFVFDYEVHKIMSLNLTNPQDTLNAFLHSSGLLSIAGTVLAILLIMGGVFIPFFLGAGLSVAFELVRGSVYYIVIMSVFLPFLNIFITLTAAKEIANFFRVDVNFMSFLKII